MQVLSDRPEDELRLWLHNRQLNVQGLSSTCSDGSTVAKILQGIWPNMLHAQHYPVTSNVDRKRINWQCLNRRVLSRIGLHQEETTCDKLARGKDNIAKTLLYEIMLKEKAHGLKKIKYETKKQRKSSIKSQERIENVCQKVDDVVIEVRQNLVPLAVYEEKLCESELKSAILNAKEYKIAYLENIVKIRKDIIDAICKRLNYSLAESESLTMDDATHEDAGNSDIANKYASNSDNTFKDDDFSDSGQE